jgi:hypothetical protein
MDGPGETTVTDTRIQWKEGKVSPLEGDVVHE